MADVTAIRAPFENVNDETVAVIRWLVDNGSFVSEGTPLVLAETTKTSFDIVAPSSGYIWQVARAGSDVPVGDVLCYLADALDQAQGAAAGPTGRGAGPSEIPGPAETAAPAMAVDLLADAAPGMQGDAAAPSSTRFSSAALVKLKELGIDQAAFAGRGLVRARDVTNSQRDGAAPAPIGERDDVSPSQSRRMATAGSAAGVPTRREALSRSKRYEGRHLRAAAAGSVQSSVSVAIPTHGFLSTDDDADMPPGTGAAIIIYETARLLRLYPIFNAYHHDGDIHYYERVNVGYAIDLGLGLKVPVIADADRKDLATIADEKRRLVVDYLSEALSLDAMSGGTFTITDLSGEGVAYVQPVLNAGQSAILGICSESVVPGADTETFSLVLAFDHQLAEGRAAAAFLRELRDRLVAHDASACRARESTASEAHCDVCLRPWSELAPDRQYLVRTVGQRGVEETVCTMCLQDW